ncbi:response regulator [Aphanothece sacrum]|uniref:histidine kinase n=1 Tax=Aphanothece sacrum FPU1 TaxID=1920663 RepID=A0A401IC18_APHSA|nr:response regulator [Aphanothece sacrum]GBF78833.1 two-component response regulator [Aphanothece sacrum FPU1]GBF83065.1 two-component response regulator [Aphanothece sacrum FPU3]
MKQKILVIEDDRATRTNLVKFLESEGFYAIEAEDGRIGIELAQIHLPELIICDILMPELDGYDVLNNLQQDPKTAAIPFIFLTVSSNNEDLRHGMELGADDYLNKPVTSDQLRAAITSRLRKQQVLLQRYSTISESSENLEQQLRQLQDLLTAKDTLLEHLSHIIRKPLVSMINTLDQFKNTSTEQERNNHIKTLQQELARFLAIVNKVSELQKILTLENAQVLNQFNFLSSELEDYEIEDKV